MNALEKPHWLRNFLYLESKVFMWASAFDYWMHMKVCASVYLIGSPGKQILSVCVNVLLCFGGFPQTCANFFPLLFKVTADKTCVPEFGLQDCSETFLSVSLVKACASLWEFERGCCALVVVTGWAALGQHHCLLERIWGGNGVKIQGEGAHHFCGTQVQVHVQTLQMWKLGTLFCALLSHTNTHSMVHHSPVTSVCWPKHWHVFALDSCRTFLLCIIQMLSLNHCPFSNVRVVKENPALTTISRIFQIVSPEGSRRKVGVMRCQFLRILIHICPVCFCWWTDEWRVTIC